MAPDDGAHGAMQRMAAAAPAPQTKDHNTSEMGGEQPQQQKVPPQRRTHLLMRVSQLLARLSSTRTTPSTFTWTHFRVLDVALPAGRQTQEMKVDPIAGDQNRLQLRQQPYCGTSNHCLKSVMGFPFPQCCPHLLLPTLSRIPVVYRFLLPLFNPLLLALLLFQQQRAPSSQVQQRLQFPQQHQRYRRR